MPRYERFGSFGACEELERAAYQAKTAASYRDKAGRADPGLTNQYHQVAAQLDSCKTQNKPGYISSIAAANIVRDSAALTKHLTGGGNQFVDTLVLPSLSQPKSSSMGLFIGLGVAGLIATIVAVVLIKKN